MEKALELKKISVSFVQSRSFVSNKKNKFYPFKDISLDVYKGEVLGIIGRNGSGKSTLLKVLNGILSPSKGIFNNFGNSTALLRLNAGLMGHLSGRDNIMLSSLYLGLDQAYIVEKMDEVIELAGLGSFIDQPIKTYSSGMKARLSFAIAYSANPDIILIDEVLSVGDAAFKDKSKKLMLEKINGGQTVVIVSHNVSLLEQVCDRIVVLTGKSIINGLTKKEALERYKRL